MVHLVKCPPRYSFFVEVNEELFPFAAHLMGYRGEGTYALIQSMKEEPKPYNMSLLLSRGLREKDVFHFQ
jgi:hypothetical protein